MTNHYDTHEIMGIDESTSVALEGELMQTTLDYGVGIDTHSKFIYVSVLCKIDAEVRRFDQTFETSWDQLLMAGKWVRHILSTKPVPAITNPYDIDHFHYTIESTSVYHYPVMRALQGHPSVINPLLASPSRRKTDALDAKLLAYQNMTGLWPQSYVVSDDMNVVRVLFAQRETHRKNAAKISNQINNYILRFGQTIGRLGSVTQQKDVRGLVEEMADELDFDRNDICPDKLPKEMAETLRGMYDAYDREVKEKDKFMRKAISKIKSLEFCLKQGQLMEGSELLKLLCTVPGISETASAIWLTNICDINRFPNPKSISAFCGLDPSLKVSAGKVTSTVKRGGNKQLHATLTNCASVLIRNRSEAFGIWGYQMYLHSGKWRKACSAVARKICVGLYWVHSKGEAFSYDGYKAQNRPEVMDIPLGTLCQIEPAFTRFRNILRDNGLLTSKAIVHAYDTLELKQIRGLGKTFFNYLHIFITNQPKYEKLMNELTATNEQGTEKVKDDNNVED